MMIKISAGGIVSDIETEPFSSATSSPSGIPRLRISGKRTGATAAMSADFEPEIPETRNMAPMRTMPRPPRMCPTMLAIAFTSLDAIPAFVIKRPRSTKSGTASRMTFETPSLMRLMTTGSGMVVVKAKKLSVAAPKQNAIGTPIDTSAPTNITKNMTRLMLPRWAKTPRPNHAIKISAIVAEATVSAIFRSCSISRMIAKTSISSIATMIAPTSHDRGRLSAGVRSFISRMKTCLLAMSISVQKTMIVTWPIASNQAEILSPALRAMIERRMCMVASRRGDRAEHG